MAAKRNSRAAETRTASVSQSKITPKVAKGLRRKMGWLRAQGAYVEVRARLTRWRCRNEQCERRIFAERIPGLAARQHRIASRACYRFKIAICAESEADPAKMAPDNRNARTRSSSACGQILHQPKGFVIVTIFCGCAVVHMPWRGFVGSSTTPKSKSSGESLSASKTVNTLSVLKKTLCGILT